MQAIEPKSEAINKAFPGYHPQWVQMSQMREITPDMFKDMREMLGINKDQCAAYLRVTSRTIRSWESGAIAVPFVVFELLRMVFESVRFKTSHKNWDGWFVSEKGILVSPNIGGNGFTPEQLDYVAYQGTEAGMLRGEVATLQRELQTAQEENTKLRQMFVSQGVVDELYGMHDRLTSLIKQMATAKIVPFQKDEQPAQLEKVA